MTCNRGALASFGMKQKKKTAQDFSLWLDITGLMLSSTFILALLVR